MDELRRRCIQRYDRPMRERLLTQGELEDMIWDYYRHTSASLQEFYSRYTPEWELFYGHEGCPPVEFIGFLQRYASVFSRYYNRTELDVAYYIGQMTRVLSDRVTVEQLREWFLDKWHSLLTVKEFDYQYRHIGELCDEFELLKGEGRDFKPGDKDLTGTRIRYLLLNNPALYRQIVPYEKAMESNRQIQQLIEVLGRNGRGEKLQFEALSGIMKEQMVRQAAPSDIEGIGLGNDLSHLLPVEYCCLSDEALYPDFALRYAEKRLQVFDSRSHEEPVSLRPGKRAVSGQGPYIVCIDTSGSMNGERERLAKSALLAIARLTENTHRKCVVINFAEEIQTLIIRDLKSALPALADFLNRRFDGGTNLFPAIDEAIRLADNNRWKRSDMVWISDFEMPPLSDEYGRKIERMKNAGTSFYALVFGTRPEMDYLNVCSRYWDMTIP